MCPCKWLRDHSSVLACFAPSQEKSSYFDPTSLQSSAPDPSLIFQTWNLNIPTKLTVEAKDVRVAAAVGGSALPAVVDDSRETSRSEISFTKSEQQNEANVAISTGYASSVYQDVDNPWSKETVASAGNENTKGVNLGNAYFSFFPPAGLGKFSPMPSVPIINELDVTSRRS